MKQKKSSVDNKKEEVEAMKQELRKVRSKVDGLALSVLVTYPEEGRCKGVVQIVHGMAEYKERYLPVMEFLAEQGYAAVIHDHRGHGGSRRRDAEQGYLYGAGAKGLITDAWLITALIKKKAPDMPVILLGHSMGSLVARCLLRRKDSAYDAVILSGSPGAHAAAPMGKVLAKMLRALQGDQRRSNLLQVMSFGEHVAKFREEESCYAWINSSEELVQTYEEDPECGFTFTTDGFVGLYELMCKTYDTEGYWCEHPELPIIFLSGADDPCYYTEKKFYSAVADMVQVGYENVSCKLYSGMRHEILNEPEKALVYEDIAAFLREEVEKREEES